MPGPAAQANAVDVVAVVQAGILGFLGIEMAVKGVDFLADFGDEVSVKKRVEVLGLGTPEFGEHELVNELVDGPALHLDRAERWFCESTAMFGGSGDREGIVKRVQRGKSRSLVSVSRSVVDWWLFGCL